MLSRSYVTDSRSPPGYAQPKDLHEETDLGDVRICDMEADIDRGFAKLLRDIEGLSGTEAVRLPLAMASRLVEFAAYETARNHNPKGVSRLILLAADLEVMSQRPAAAPSAMN